MRSLTSLVVSVLLTGPVSAAAQSAVTYRAELTAEATTTQANRSSPLVRPGSSDWTNGSLFVATGAGSWEDGGRLKLAGGLALTGSSGDTISARTREAYARLSATDWMDVEAGKRLLRWGVGYGFSPAGVLDPPRLATDPTDRLGVNEGMPLARVDLFRRGSSLTVAVAAPRAARHDAVAASSRIVAARLHTGLPGGVEVALIASAAPDAGPSWGGTVTHVVGQRLEWHAEVMEQDAKGSRAISAVAGVQYTFLPGVNVVLEYHRNGRGLDDAEWNATLRGSRTAGAMPGRQQFLFARAALPGAGARLAPELILIAGLDDGSRTLVPGVTWRPRGRVQIHGRATRLLGDRRSIAGVAPWSTSLTVGATVRF
jgi:hypothetical protein